MRALSPDERQSIATAIELTEIQHIENEVAAMGQMLDATVKPFDLHANHIKRLIDPNYDRKGTELSLESPDSYLLEHADLQTRIIFRLASKQILTQVRRLVAIEAKKAEEKSTLRQDGTPEQQTSEDEKRSPVLDRLIKGLKTIPVHRQITGYVDRWHQNGGPETKFVKAKRQRSSGKALNRGTLHR